MPNEFESLGNQSLQWPPPSGAHVDPAMSLTPSNSSTKDEHAIRLTINKSSAYDRNFGQHLIDHGIYPKDHCPPEDEDRRASRPSNEKEIRDRLARPRPSFSHISDDAFFKFTSSEAQAPNEATMILKSFPVILGDANIPSSANLLFNNLKPLTDGTLVAAKPDFCDGARPERIDPRIREELASYITPSTQWRAPVLPNLFIEAKSQQGSEAVVTCQAQYDGALGARGIHQLRSFGARALPVYDNKAYTITATYYNGHLRLYTSHPTPPVGPGRDSEYRMTQVGGWDLTDSVERFCLGVGAFRNARDWAKEQRDRIIEATNARLKISGPSGDISAQRSAPLESNPSNNELTGDIIGNDATSHRHPKRKSEKGHQERKAKRRRS